MSTLDWALVFAVTWMGSNCLWALHVYQQGDEPTWVAVLVALFFPVFVLIIVGQALWDITRKATP